MSAVDNDSGALLACPAFDKYFPMSEWMMVTVEDWAIALRHVAVQDTNYFARWPKILPSRQKDASVDWCAIRWLCPPS